MKSIQGILTGSIVFINSTVVPLLFALAFLFFLVNITRYFIIGGGNEEGRKKARLLALWGIIAFVVMVSIWGIVSLFLSTFGSYGKRTAPICPDSLNVSDCYQYDQTHVI